MVSMVITRGVHRWVRADRDVVYRRRRDALRARRGVTGFQLAARGRS